MYREEYIEAHTLELDIEWSRCGECEFGQKDNCQHYYGKGCVYND